MVEEKNSLNLLKEGISSLIGAPTCTHLNAIGSLLLFVAFFYF